MRIFALRSAGRTRPCSRLTLAALAWLLLALGPPALARTPAQARAEAERLVERGRAYEQRETFEGRRMASQCFQRAVLLVPEHAPYRVILGDLYLRQGFLRNARLEYEAALRADSSSADAQFGLGHVWRRDYLKYLDRTSLRHAVEGFSACARLAPGRCDGWVQLSPLLFERGDLRAARAAALRAYEADAKNADALLAVAQTAYHAGEVELAERAFARALPRLQWQARAYFESIDPVATAEDTFQLHRLATTAEQAEFVRRFWKSLDPDLATPVNEAQVAFWARAAQAYFLFYDRRRKEWDQRGEVYVRYGPPEKAEYNPIVRPRLEAIYSLRLFPYNTLVWSYPSLGMTVPMTDRTLNGFYGLPVSLYEDMDPRPSPDSIASKSDSVLVSRQGRGVFPRLRPGARPLPLWAALARFRGADTSSTRLLAALATPGGPADVPWSEAVVLDSALREVGRARRVLGASACDPTGERAAEFSFDLPPGDYLVGLSLDDGRGGRAAWRSRLAVPGRSRRLDLSDLELTCGPPPAAGDPQFRVAPNPGAEVPAGEPVGVYFEVYGLRPGADGKAHYSIEYTVRSAERDPRPWVARLFARRPVIPAISALRRDEHLGELRRQYVSIPAQGLPAGRYRLVIKLVDEVAQATVEREAAFEKL